MEMKPELLSVCVRAKRFLKSVAEDLDLDWTSELDRLRHVEPSRC